MKVLDVTKFYENKAFILLEWTDMTMDANKKTDTSELFFHTDVWGEKFPGLMWCSGKRIGFRLKSAGFEG